VEGWGWGTLRRATRRLRGIGGLKRVFCQRLRGTMAEVQVPKRGGAFSTLEAGRLITLARGNGKKKEQPTAAGKVPRGGFLTVDRRSWKQRGSDRQIANGGRGWRPEGAGENTRGGNSGVQWVGGLLTRLKAQTKNGPFLSGADRNGRYSVVALN